jgi:hypothetical protein
MLHIHPKIDLRMTKNNIPTYRINDMMDSNALDVNCLDIIDNGVEFLALCLISVLYARFGMNIKTRQVPDLFSEY